MPFHPEVHDNRICVNVIDSGFPPTPSKEFPGCELYVIECHDCGRPILSMELVVVHHGSEIEKEP